MCPQMFYISTPKKIFLEVEDRRRRAELLVKKQQSFIEGLKDELVSVQDESQKKIVSY